MLLIISTLREQNGTEEYNKQSFERANKKPEQFTFKLNALPAKYNVFRIIQEEI